MNNFLWKFWKIGFCLSGLEVSKFLYVRYTGYESIYKRMFWRFYFKQNAQWIPQNNPNLITWSKCNED